MMRIAFAVLLALVLAACGERERDAADDVPPVADDTPTAALPTPEAAPGTSVTGMPTQPPPPRPLADATEVAPTDAGAAPPAPVDGSDPAAPLPAPVDGTVPPPADGSAPGATPALPVDTAAATGVVTQYLAAVSSGALTNAQALWSTTPNDSAVMQLARGPTFDVSVGNGAADGTDRVLVPVDIHGRSESGGDRHVQVAYAVQRTPTGPWRIVTATVRDATP